MRRHKVLIANRGEIACRIQRSCRALGIPAVAVYSEPDARALHVEMADEAVGIGPALPQHSYLNIGNLLNAARAVGATAIHPGYGFLSESPEFARAVTDAGLVWIGPSSAVIGDMGDKERARSIAVATGLPVLPGSGRFSAADRSGLAAQAARIGYPLLVKAAAGGGGIGMRRVERGDELDGIAAGAQAIAKRLFADDAIYLERLLVRPRHIEVQIFGCGVEGAIHLFERECSIQRRYQKVVEEAPAPHLDADVRDALIRNAVALAEAQDYRGPGTVEYLVDAETNEFFFLEMNTRIQVEHPVTELITGQDLVAMHLLLELEGVAPVEQPTRADGHAIECRLYAENPAAGFKPSPGRLLRLDLPDDPCTRYDFGYRAGDTVTAYYDPLIGKIIVHGENRSSALDSMRRVLSRTRVEGINCNLEFLQRVLQHEAFDAGRIDTLFVETHRDDLLVAA